MNCNNKWSYFYLFSWTFFVISGSLWLADPDVFWHLKVGELIVINGVVPTTDTFSWSVYGEQWTAHQWLWDVILYLCHEYFGLIGMWVLTFIMGFISGMLIRSGLIMRGVSEQVATVAGGVGVLLLLGWLKPWPQAGMYALFSAYLFLSLRNRWRLKEIFYCAGIGLLWGNIHSTAVMLPLLLLAEVVWKLLFRRNELQDIWWRISAAMVSGFATLINPHGVGLWAYAFGQGLLTNIYRENIISWMPYHFGINWMTPLFLISMFILFFAVRQGKEKELVFIRAASFWVLALMSRIYSPFAILSTASLLGVINMEITWASIKRLAFIALSGGFVIMLSTGIPSNIVQVAEKSNYPISATEYIEDQGLIKIYNDHGWGGYLLWNNLPVYIDGRNDVYADIIEEHLYINKLDKPIGESVMKTGAKTVLTRVNGLIDIALMESKWWIEVYRDNVAVIYINKK